MYSTWRKADKRLLLMLLMVCLPSAPIALVATLAFCAGFVIRDGVNYWKTCLILTGLVLSSVYTVTVNGLSYFVNVFMGISFLMPFFTLLVLRESKEWFDIDSSKAAFEVFLFIQIAFSLSTAFYFYFFGGRGSLDVDFGDVVAGTFRTPFTYQVDSATKVFSFTITISLLFYYFRFTNAINKLLLVFGLMTAFLTSVNHLILAVCAGFGIAYLWRKPWFVVAGVAVMVLLYSLLQPQNFSMIQSRLTVVVNNLSELNDLFRIGPKGEYIAIYVRNVMSNPFEFIVSGVGLGQYSGRAAMYLSGEFVDFSMKSISSYTRNDVLPLFRIFRDAPGFMRGAFYYPYNGFVSLLAEYGMISTVCAIALMWKKFSSLRHVRNGFAIVITIFVILATLVDHYLEYYSAWAVLMLMVRFTSTKSMLE